MLLLKHGGQCHEEGNDRTQIYRIHGILFCFRIQVAERDGREVIIVLSTHFTFSYAIISVERKKLVATFNLWIGKSLHESAGNPTARSEQQDR
jgi:hypothetical protein